VPAEPSQVAAPAALDWSLHIFAKREKAERAISGDFDEQWKCGFI
jgi:hypothetical protein